MKAKILDINGKEKATIELPKFFSEKIREDLILKAVEIKKSQQPFSPSPVSGKQHSASGILKHHRKVWKSQYGRKMSRVPRKIFSVKGSQFNWEGAEVSNTRGGRTAHPPKITSRINTGKLNKKELKKATTSALSATAEGKWVAKKYSNLKDKKITALPLIVESKLVSQKAKALRASIKSILGEDLFGVAEKKRSIRHGVGKMRGRKYKSNAGLLVVIGDKEKLRTNIFEIQKASNVGVLELAQGGPGRLTLYTEAAIKELASKFNSSPKSQTKELENKFGDKKTK